MINDDGKVEYGEYSDQELQEAHENIAADRYPKNFENLLIEFERRGLQPDSPKVTAVSEELPEDHPLIGATKSTKTARITGLVTFVLGVVMILLRYDEGVYRGRNGFEYTFDQNPLLLSFLLLLHGVVIFIGLMGMFVGPKFYRGLIKSQSEDKLHSN